MRRYTLSLCIDFRLIEAARVYYDSINFYVCADQTFRISNVADSKPIPKWHEAFTLNFSGNKGVIVPIERTDCIAHHTILLYKDYTDSFYAELVTLVPDNPGGTTTLQSFTGYIIHGVGVANLMRVHSFDQKKITYNRPNKAIGLGYRSQLNHHEDKEKNLSDEMDKPVDPSESQTTFVVTTGDRLISNIKDYLKCFDNVPNSDHTYLIKLCVLQPIPGSREPWAFHSFGNKVKHNPVFVGHTYLILTAITPNKTTTRNVGFYPKDTVHPFSPISQGVLNNDEEDDYDIALSITTTSSQFNSSSIGFPGDHRFMYAINFRGILPFHRKTGKRFYRRDPVYVYTIYRACHRNYLFTYKDFN
jgi:hypothetical protein